MIAELPIAVALFGADRPLVAVACCPLCGAVHETWMPTLEPTSAVCPNSPAEAPRRYMVVAATADMVLRKLRGVERVG